MKRKVLLLIFAVLCVVLCISGCGANKQNQNTSIQMPETTEATTEPPKPDAAFWPDIVELLNVDGDGTTAYKLEDGKYMDRIERVFSYDGMNKWTCTDGSVWHRAGEEVPLLTNVTVEFGIDRFLAQRTDKIYFSDANGSRYALKIVFGFDTVVTNFSFLSLDGEFSKEGDFICQKMETTFSKEEIKPNDLLVIETVLDGLVPTRGIRFVDASGSTVSYYLALSGRDDVPLLVPFGK